MTGLVGRDEIDDNPGKTNTDDKETGNSGRTVPVRKSARRAMDNI